MFNAFAVAAFFEFVVFAIFEMRYLLLVWRARRANALDPWAAQRELSVLYARFYGVLLAGVFLGYQLHLCAPPASQPQSSPNRVAAAGCCAHCLPALHASSLGSWRGTSTSVERILTSKRSL